jgi:hypothetical protein
MLIPRATANLGLPRGCPEKDDCSKLQIYDLLKMTTTDKTTAKITSLRLLEILQELHL